MVRVSTRPRVISLVAAATEVFSRSRASRAAYMPGWLPSTGHRNARLDLARVAGVVPGRLHRVRGDNGAAQRQRFQQRLEVRYLVRLPGLGDLVAADHQPGDVGDRPQQVHLLLPAGLGELAFLAVHRHRHPGRDVTWFAGDRRVQPRVAGCRPDQPSAGSRAARPRHAAGAAAPPCAAGPRHARAARDCAAGSSAAPATSPVSAASSSSGSRRSPSRSTSTPTAHPPPGHRAHPAAVPGQHLLAQPAAACAIASGLRCPQATPPPAPIPATPARAAHPAARWSSAAPPPHPGASASSRLGRGQPRRYPGGGRRHRPAIPKTRARLRGDDPTG